MKEEMPPPCGNTPSCCAERASTAPTAVPRPPHRRTHCPFDLSLLVRPACPVGHHPAASHRASSHSAVLSATPWPLSP